MSHSVGIIGLPNVGKSTLFNALTSASVPAENYPFCTIEPNLSIVKVPDEDLEKLFHMVCGKELTHSTVEFIDVAGLIEGSHKGEGLGNQFLSTIRGVDAIAHVVRCFDSPDVVYQYSEVDPVREIAIIRSELALSDVELVQRRLEKLRKGYRPGPGEVDERALFERVLRGLESSEGLKKTDFSAEQQKVLSSVQLLALKPVMYVANVFEDAGPAEKKMADSVSEAACLRGSMCIRVCAKLEMELAELDASERSDFMKEMRIGEAVLPRLIRSCYELLDVVTFYTVASGKVRAWTIERGSTAAEAAGKIHTDIREGFIKAEAVSLDDVLEYGSLQNAGEKGCVRIEGRDYAVRDKDVILFHFKKK